jgi:hypothetical protein
MPHSLDASAFFLRISTRKPVRIRLRYERPNARHHPPRGPLVELNNRGVRGRVHAVVMVERLAAAVRARSAKHQEPMCQESGVRAMRIPFKPRHTQWREGGPSSLRQTRAEP